MTRVLNCLKRLKNPKKLLVLKKVNILVREVKSYSQMYEEDGFYILDENMKPLLAFLFIVKFEKIYR